VGCLFAVAAGIAPRIALVLLWIFTNLVNRAFSNIIVPLLGLFFLPYATLFYVLAWDPRRGVSNLGWVVVIIGVIFDIGHWGGNGYARRQRAR
jgi:hypothetical protein